MTVNKRHISIGPHWPVPIIMVRVLAGAGIAIPAMSAMPDVPIGMYPGASLRTVPTRSLF
jgi:hypothetical protein